MPKENTIKLPEQELAEELVSLHKELTEFTKAFPDQLDSTEAVWVFRMFQGLSSSDWEDFASKHDLSQWLSLPVNEDSYPQFKRFQELLEHLAYQTDHDALTGLANRRAFDRILDIEIERSKRAKTPLSLAIFDLDDFKVVNDTYGHCKGDEVLVKFAAHLKASTRRYDLAARFGGEEFALIMAGSGVVRAQRLLERLLSEFREMDFETPDGSATFKVTCSVGLTCFKGSINITDKELIDLADTALYDAKAAGKDQIKLSKLPFVDNVPNETLVQANEKQFLFGGK